MQYVDMVDLWCLLRSNSLYKVSESQFLIFSLIILSETLIINAWRLHFLKSLFIIAMINAN